MDNHSGWCQDNTSFGTFSGDNQDKLVAFWVEGIMVPTVGGIGICGNIASIMVLSKREFKDTFHKLLISLSLVDSTFIICAVFTFLVRSQGLLEGPLSNILAPLFLICLALGSCALVTSMYLTISISVERYFGICYPIQSRVQGRRRLCVYLVPVIFFSLLFNLPKFLEITPGGELNWKLSNNLLYNKIYGQYAELTVTVVIPLLALLCFNCRIYLAVRNSRGFGNSVRQRRENNLALILITIVVVFLCCQSLKFFLAFYKVHVTTKTLYCDTLGLSPWYPKWMHTVSYINHFMLVLNSSTNFIIYCFVGTRFRKSLLLSFYSHMRCLNIMNNHTNSSTTLGLSRQTEMSYISRTPSPRDLRKHEKLQATNSSHRNRSQYRHLHISDSRLISQMDDQLSLTYCGDDN
eukprot:GFUD01041884.1.p1 GENE.GFUD01041884.1~~GFUD01041884.1.p1  ORF type:complete len:407 (-),score=61.26 GFUD01041884.1:820-2040(-)